MSNNASPVETALLGNGQSQKAVVGPELPEEVRSSAMRAGVLDVVVQSGRTSSPSSPLSPVLAVVGMLST